MKKSTASPPDDPVRPSTNGSGHKLDALPLDPPRALKSKVPQALLAGLLIVGGGLGGLILFSRYNQRTPAVIVSAAVPHGQELTRQDLAITEVALDGEVATMGSISEVVGLHAAHDLRPGELVSPGDLATAEQLVTAGESVVGLLLEPGQYPTRRMVAGDRVDVFAPDPEFPSQGPLASNLVVFDVIESSSDGRTLLVSLVATSDDAALIFDASDGNGVRLSLRGRE